MNVLIPAIAGLIAVAVTLLLTFGRFARGEAWRATVTPARLDHRQRLPDLRAAARARVRQRRGGCNGGAAAARLCCRRGDPLQHRPCRELPYRCVFPRSGAVVCASYARRAGARLRRIGRLLSEAARGVRAEAARRGRGLAHARVEPPRHRDHPCPDRAGAGWRRAQGRASRAWHGVAQDRHHRRAARGTWLLVAAPPRRDRTIAAAQTLAGQHTDVARAADHGAGVRDVTLPGSCLSAGSAGPHDAPCTVDRGWHLPCFLGPAHNRSSAARRRRKGLRASSTS